MSRPLPMVDFFFVPPSDEQEIEDLRVMLKNPAARRMFRRLLGSGNVLGPSLGNSEANTTYNEGVRAVGLWLATKIERAAPGDLSRLMLESAMDLQGANNKQGK
ncbi:hypothetical protein LJC59_01285 [Desulfovibrio sp. OttesenSCG-928-A18]|nr:hypothetical protein [Desulfovibrio sp. OttesenSCG-928-A18]